MVRVKKVREKLRGKEPNVFRKKKVVLSYPDPKSITLTPFFIKYKLEKFGTLRKCGLF